MTFGEILSTVLLTPLQLIFEFIFKLSNQALNNPGFSIMALSLAVNLLLMPLYRRADALQKEEREMVKRLEKGVAHIKKTFQGDERMMILQAYYREHHYKPTYALRSAAPLLLQIPFFLAAYRFLSSLALLQGVGFGPIADLSQPDGLLRIGGMAVNVLPFVMTAVNLVTATLFTRDAPRKEKLQLYGMAAFFLVFLYNSPSALVFYWTLNNLFSLAKTLLGQWKHAGAFLRWALLLVGLLCAAMAILRWDHHSFRRLVTPVGLGLLLSLPLLLRLLPKRQKPATPERTPNGRLFFLEMLFLAALTGLLIPSNVLAASPTEFVFSTTFFHPNWFLVSSFATAFGLLVLWGGIFYALAGNTAKVLTEKLALLCCCAGVVNSMSFGTDLGLLNASLCYDLGLAFTRMEQLGNLLVLVLLCAGLWLLMRFGILRPGKLTGVMAVCTAATVCVGLWNGVRIDRLTQPLQDQLAQEASSQQPEDQPHFPLSKEGKNVVILMLDRGMSAYVPYLFQERPELKAQFDGFTFYPNSLSHGSRTIIGAPPIYGGYEYTPAKMNQRNTMRQSDKHDEALKVLPTIFGEEGYQVTLLDPPFAGYQFKSDLSVFDGIPGVSAYNTMDYTTDEESYNQKQDAQMREALMRNFFCFGLMKSAPLLLQPTLYDNSSYNRCASAEDSLYSGQIVLDMHTAEGYFARFIQSYNVLRQMRQMTSITSDAENTFLIMKNNTAHDVMLLQEPDYVPSAKVDNRKYDAEHADRFTLDGRTLEVTYPYAMASYQCNMAAFLQLGAWFDYLRENGVYDNTRIILVSDHGIDLHQIPELILDENNDLQSYLALLMVKDFGSTGSVQTCGDFMTVADVPTLAMENLVENPVNPFTGNPITSAEKTAHDQYVHDPGSIDLEENNGFQLLPGTWLKVHDNIWDPDNWTHLGNQECITAEE